MTLAADVQTLEPGAKIELYELDLTSLGAGKLWFHGYTQQGTITWQGQAYEPWAIDATGFARTGDGPPTNPTLSVGNIARDIITGEPVVGAITALCIAYDDLVGAKLVRHMTLGKYLDTINFPYGNPSADPTQEFPLEIWYIEQKTSEVAEVVTFMLSSALDFNGVQLPGRTIVASVCGWIRIGGYRGPYCNYTGPNMFDVNGNPVGDLAHDKCGGRLSDCKLRFGQYEILNFENFPSAGIIRQA